jgi:myo-inositol-1(or 4)-monophosphatase
MKFNDEALARDIESVATQLAQGAGEILLSHFGHRITIEYKDKERRDPVTSADKASHEYLVAEITRRFPSHGILSEEDSDRTSAPGEATSSPAPDFLWVLDPLDGTTNFLNGLPIYAVSIGVLYRGWPIVGAVHVPWPRAGGGFVLHCHRGGGCFADTEPVSVYQSDGPVANRLTGLPASFAAHMRFGRKVSNPWGEMRTTGSIAYELAMTACGVMQYSIFYSPRMWDMAGGSLAVLEANGAVITRFAREKRWHPLESLVSTWEDRPPDLKELRRWTVPLVAGNQQVAPMIASNMHRRFRLANRLRWLSHHLHPFRKRPSRRASPGRNSTLPAQSARRIR